jgi:hypothetical protein
MDENAGGFAVDAELQGALQAAIDAAAQQARGSVEASARPDTVSAAGGSGLATHVPGFMVPADLGVPPAPPQDSPAGTMTFADPLAFAVVDLTGAGLPPGPLLAPPDTLGGAVTTVADIIPAGAVTATLPDGTTLSFADIGAPLQ